MAEFGGQQRCVGKGAHSERYSRYGCELPECGLDSLLAIAIGWYKRGTHRWQVSYKDDVYPASEHEGWDGSGDGLFSGRRCGQAGIGAIHGGLLLLQRELSCPPSA